MTFTSPLDIAITAILLIRRFGLGRVLLLSPVIVPLFLWSLPPQPCGCIRMPFVRCLDGRPRAYRAAVKSDLKNFVTQQEIYYADHYEYTDDFADLGFVASVDVTVVVSSVSDSGWKATATHAGLDPDEACAVSVGSAPAPTVGSERPATAGAIVCTN